MLLKLLFVATVVSASNIPPYATFTYCTPSQSCWPSASSWSAFNTSIGGRLVQTVPWAAPCYLATYDEAKCTAISNNYLDGFNRSSVIGATEELNWEACGSDNCYLFSGVSTPFLPELGTCKLGRLSPYAVNASSTEDVVTTIKWAHQNKIKLVIKNTGHEYLGRGTAPDSLMLWTHNLNSISYTDSYTPDGCATPSPPVPAAIMGSGIQAGEAYDFAGQYNHSITLGATPSVGVAGGFAQGGGHGPLGRLYGLAVDNMLQYTIVGVDGVVRKANACQNTDLFWALRGGGGGSWGVVVETVFKLHPQTPIQCYGISVKPSLINGLINEDAVFHDFVQTLASYTIPFSTANGAGYTFIYPGVAGIQSNYTLIYGFPTSNREAIVNLTTPMTNYFTQSSKYSVVDPGVVISFDTLQDFIDGIVNPGNVNTPVGYGEILGSRLLPKSLFNTTAGQISVANAVLAGKNINVPPLSAQKLLDVLKPVPIQIYSTGPGDAWTDNSQTGVNPAWRGSEWEVVFSSGYTQFIPQSLIADIYNATSSATNPLRALTPGGGTYYSESDVLEPDWQQAFFGSNYAELQSIKQKYDPENYLNVYKGVAWTGLDNSTYRCYNM